MAVRPDGRILVAGSCTQTNGSRDVCLVQFRTTGGTDSTFEQTANGRVVINRVGDETANAVCSLRTAWRMSQPRAALKAACLRSMPMERWTAHSARRVLRHF